MAYNLFQGVRNCFFTPGWVETDTHHPHFAEEEELADQQSEDEPNGMVECYNADNEKDRDFHSSILLCFFGSEQVVLFFTITLERTAQRAVRLTRSFVIRNRDLVNCFEKKGSFCCFFFGKVSPSAS